jgi:hypothetical protein
MACTLSRSQAGSVLVGYGTGGVLSLTCVANQLEVDFQGAGLGTITSSSGPLNCSWNCAHAYQGGAQVTLTAAASPGSSFQGWSGACESKELTCSLTVSGLTQVTASFSVNPATQLNLEIGGYGVGTVTSSPAGISCASGACSANFPQNTVVTLTAAPASGSAFTGWSGACGGVSPTCTVTVSSTTYVGATFVSPAVVVTLHPVGTQACGFSSCQNIDGTISMDPAYGSCTSENGAPYTWCTVSVPPGAVVTFKASSPFGGATWTDACSSAGTVATCTLTIEAATTVGATFP